MRLARIRFVVAHGDEKLLQGGMKRKQRVRDSGEARSRCVYYYRGVARQAKRIGSLTLIGSAITVVA